MNVRVVLRVNPGVVLALRSVLAGPCGALHTEGTYGASGFRVFTVLALLWRR